MKQIRMLLVAACALSLAACGPMAAADGAIASAGSTSTTAEPMRVTGPVVLEGKRALILADNAYQGATTVLAPLIRAKKFSASQVDQIERMNSMAYSLLNETIPTGLSYTERADRVFRIVDQLNLFKGK